MDITSNIAKAAVTLLDEKPESEKVSLGVRTTVNPTVKVQPTVCSVLSILQME